MRALSSAARRAMFDQETDKVFLLLIAISGAGLTLPLRFCNNSSDIVREGNTYLAYPFQISLPDEREDQPAQVALAIDNIDQHIVTAVRLLTEAPKVTLEVVLASSPDTLEAGPFDFALRGVEYDSLVVRGNLSFEDFLGESYPSDSMTPADFAGLYAA